MICKFLLTLATISIILGCYEPERNCQAFRDGRFSFSSEVGGETKTTTFVRENDREIDFYEGKSDTSEVRWINDCEYILKKLNPKNASEEKSIHIKILTTKDDSYTFEYNVVGNSNKSSGTAYKTN